MAGADLDNIRNHTNRKYEMAAEDGDKTEIRKLKAHKFKMYSAYVISYK